MELITWGERGDPEGKKAFEEGRGEHLSQIVLAIQIRLRIIYHCI